MDDSDNEIKCFFNLLCEIKPSEISLKTINQEEIVKVLIVKMVNYLKYSNVVSLKTYVYFTFYRKYCNEYYCLVQ